MKVGLAQEYRADQRTSDHSTKPVSYDGQSMNSTGRVLLPDKAKLSSTFCALNSISPQKDSRSGGYVPEVGKSLCADITFHVFNVHDSVKTSLQDPQQESHCKKKAMQRVATSLKESHKQVLGSTERD